MNITIKTDNSIPKVLVRKTKHEDIQNVTLYLMPKLLRNIEETLKTKKNNKDWLELEFLAEVITC